MPIVTDNGDVYPTYVDTDLHTEGSDRDSCRQHLRHEDGTADGIEEAFRDKVRQGKILPVGEEKLIRYRRECFGCNELGRCGMQIVQYDREGNQISQA